MSPGAPQTPAGWYPNPDDPRQQRWWDGAQWGPVADAQAAAPAPGGEEKKSKRGLVLVLVLVLLLLLLGSIAFLVTRRPKEVDTSSATVPLATAPATEEGLEDSVKSFWSALINRDLPTARSYRTKQCQGHWTLQDEEQSWTALSTSFESSFRRPLDSSLSVAEIGTSNVGAARATILYVDLTGVDGSVYSDRASAKATDWIYEDGAWRITTC